MPSQSIISALRAAYSLAALAYWKDEIHCGSDLDASGHCIDCQHHKACILSAAYHLDIAKALKEGGE